MNIFGLSTFELVLTVLSAVASVGSVLVLLREFQQKQKLDKDFRAVQEKMEKRAAEYYTSVEAQAESIYELYDSFTLSHYAADKNFRSDVKQLVKKVLPPSEHPDQP